ncbi:MAG: hypothetical protein ACREXR_04795 [Gammaproteobacteria bacterium]
MSMKFRIALAVCLLALASTAHAWSYFPNAKILGIVQWQDGSPVYLEVAPGTYCYIPASEKNMIALIFSLYSSGRPSDIHCYPTADTFGGMPGYRLHRIISH